MSLFVRTAWLVHVNPVCEPSAYHPLPTPTPYNNLMYSDLDIQEATLCLFQIQMPYGGLTDQWHV